MFLAKVCRAISRKQVFKLQILLPGAGATIPIQRKYCERPRSLPLRLRHRTISRPAGETQLRRVTFRRRMRRNELIGAF